MVNDRSGSSYNSPGALLIWRNWAVQALLCRVYFYHS
jgi:hypothetical protein